jgi:hypothetical protein
VFPAQGLGAMQVTTTEVVATPWESESAREFRLMFNAPGVVPPPDIVSQGTDGETENE